MTYESLDGRVLTRSLESHITDHCNLRCRQCCSLSPYLPRWCVEPDRLQEDLRLAARALKPRYLKLVGGEPLLHPRLLECLEIARASGLAEIVSLTTNGFLLPRMPDRLWELLDHMTISIYPDPRLPGETMALVRERAARHQVVLNIKVQDQFQEMHPPEPRDDPALTRRIFEDCWLKRRCHMVREGRFYMCTVPPHFHTYFGGRGDYGRVDGVALHEGPDLAAEIKAYLERTEPLDSCKRCWGGSGEKRGHRQLTTQEVRDREEGPR